MKQLDSFTAGVDARHAASEASQEWGFAWLVHAGRCGWVVVFGESLDDQPATYDAAFAGGIQQ